MGYTTTTRGSATRSSGQWSPRALPTATYAAVWRADTATHSTGSLPASGEPFDSNSGLTRQHGQSCALSLRPPGVWRIPGWLSSNARCTHAATVRPGAVAPWRATTLRGPHWADATQVGRILPRELGIRDAQVLSKVVVEDEQSLVRRGGKRENRSQVLAYRL